MAENLEQRRDEVAQGIARLTGQDLKTALNEVDLSIQRLFYWGAYADKFGGTVQVSTQVQVHLFNTWHCKYRVAPKKRNSQFFRTLLWSTVIFFTLLDRASFPHYNNTKIIKFGWELFSLWVISYGLSFSGFARFPEFRGTINDSFGRP